MNSVRETTYLVVVVPWQLYGEDLNFEIADLLWDRNRLITSAGPLRYR